MKTIILLLTIFMSGNVLSEKTTAPFGLEWGASVKEIKALGVNLEMLKHEGGVSIYTARRLLQNLSLAESYELTFDDKYKLQKISMISEVTDNDVNGDKGKANYSSIKNKLIKKYGKPDHDIEYDGTALIGAQRMLSGNSWYEATFYEGLATDAACWCMSFEAVSGDIRKELDLYALSVSSGVVILGYEGRAAEPGRLFRRV